MGQTIGQRQNKYRSKLRRRILGTFNYRCCSCHTKDNLEFAHIEQSFLGNGRGLTVRLVMVYKYPWSFMLMCHKCHTAYDLMNNRSNKRSESKEEFKEKIKINIEKVRLEYSKEIRTDCKEYYQDMYNNGVIKI